MRRSFRQVVRGRIALEAICGLAILVRDSESAYEALAHATAIYLPTRPRPDTIQERALQRVVFLAVEFDVRRARFFAAAAVQPDRL